MAQTKIKHLTKKEMREDQVKDLLSTIYWGAADTLEKNWQLYLSGTAIILALLGLFLFFKIQAKHKAETGGELIATISEHINTPVGISDTPKNQTDSANTVRFKNEEERRKDIEGLISQMTKSYSHTPSYSLVPFYQAILALEKKDNKKALELVDKAIQVVKPANKSLLIEARARIKNITGDAKGEEADLKLLADGNYPNYPKSLALLNLGEFYENHNEKEKAIDIYQKIITEKKPDKDKSMVEEEAKNHLKNLGIELPQDIPSLGGSPF